MKVLVACEESQEVCKAFRALGHEAYSCDIIPCSGGHPEWHLMCDALEMLKMKWDLIIAHPPCTYMTVTGNRWFNVERYGEAALQRERERRRNGVFHGVCKRTVRQNRNRKPDRLHEHTVEKAGADNSALSIRARGEKINVFVVEEPAEAGADGSCGAGNLLVQGEKREDEKRQQVAMRGETIGMGEEPRKDVPGHRAGDGGAVGRVE